ncbi:protein FAM91A1-like [Saccostrea echinata]|uniref:protein FAM91A1-like n=1 Tax=Saccostrea echinata TaxID=191078 RepID=UPI002A81972D|nr:protein FAM91A1-like [Saccostrea echinata]
MNSDVENQIRLNNSWQKLPAAIKQILGNSQREYDKAIVQFSIKNQLRYKGNLVRTVRKDERRYYEDLMHYSQEHLMLYPYHLSDVIVKGLRVTPFTYYINMMSDIMTQEKSYDSLPNFTAADCLRLLGIGRNQYIDLMNQCRSSKKFFRRKPPKDLLPAQPVETVTFEHWWLVNVGYITEEDVKMCSVSEKNVIDSIIDSEESCQLAGEMDYKIIQSLYRKGLIYLNVPIKDDDCIIVPPLEGFVMNRVLGDYLETLLYKIFVSIDEHTAVSELAHVLQIDSELVKNAISMYCRLGFAKKKGAENINAEDLHPSWINIQPTNKKMTKDQIILDWNETSEEALLEANKNPVSQDTNNQANKSALETAMEDTSPTSGATRRIAFLFDSTLTAFLMMGNLSPGLKSHAVTMFEVGKLSDESLDSFLAELEKVGSEAEGEARRYFVHALTLRDTVRFLRYNKELNMDTENGNGLAVDLIRCESLLGLDAATRARVLNRNYSLLVSMAPLSYEIRPVSSCVPQHIGPAIPEVNSVWFKLYTYHISGCGPPSLLLVKGTKLRRLPKMFYDYDRLLVTTWGHDPGVIATSNILLTLNDALTHSAVLVQAHGWQSEGKTVTVAFPFEKEVSGDFSSGAYQKHSAIQTISLKIDLINTCGYITLLNTGKESRTVWKDNHEEDFYDVDVFNDEEISEPCNGVKDQQSADVLAMEIDMLELESEPKENSIAQPLNRNLKLDLSKKQVSCDVSKEEDWALLDCYFGIPLFDSYLNKEICSKVVNFGLFKQEGLQELLHSSRKLSLRLLNFISQYQDIPTNDTLSDPLLPSDNEQTPPLPTVCLQFYKGKLERWNCK